MTRNKKIGSTFDGFLQDEELLPEVEILASKKILAWQIKEEMEKLKITKKEMAKKMHTSRIAVDRLLNPNNSSLTLKCLGKAAHVLHKKVRMELCDSCTN